MEDSKRDASNGLAFGSAKQEASLGFPIEIDESEEQPRALAASELLEKRRALLAQAHAMLSAMVRFSPPDARIGRARRR